MELHAGKFRFQFPRPALVMGILNVTPDSFSDGGRYLDCEAAVAHGLELERQGAEILDVGGESTRPNAVPVAEAEELRRVLPVIERLTREAKVPISIDTMKPGVARAALAAGASIVNDVGANRSETEMWRITAKAGAGYVCMHMQGTPRTMQAEPHYQDVVREVRDFFSLQMEQMFRCGLSTGQIIVDPGIGFGKTLEHNLELLGGLRELASFGQPLLLGVSRKSFLGKLLGAGLESRLAPALACACLAVEAGANILRVHDVAETLQAIRMTEAILARRRK